MPEGRVFTNHIQMECMCNIPTLFHSVWADQGSLSLYLSQRIIIYCCSCAVEWCSRFSWWKFLGLCMLLSQNGFTMLIHVIFLVFKLSTYIPLMLLTSWPLAIMCEATRVHSASWLITYVWLCNTCLLLIVGAYFNSSKAWLLSSLLLTLTELGS